MPQWVFPWNPGIAAASVVPDNLGPQRQWIRVGSALTFTSFSAAALSNSIPLFLLPASVLCSAIKIKHQTSFTGGSISAYTVSVGDVSTPTLYASAFNVFQAAGPTIYQLSNELTGESTTAAVQIYATATAVGANLSAATAGVLNIWAELSAVA